MHEVYPETTDFVAFLQTELAQRCRQNPRYSLRAFAKNLGVHHGVLSLFIRHKRPISPKMITKLGRKLGLPDFEIKKYIVVEEGVQPEIRSLDHDTFEAISNWYYFAILELTRLENFQPDASWISRILDININTATIAINKLLKLGFLAVDINGRYVDKLEFSNISAEGFTTAAIRKISQQILEKSLKSLQEDRLEERTHQRMTIAVEAKDIELVRNRLRDFRKQLTIELTNHKKPDAVYELQMAFFPLTKNSKTNVKESNSAKKTGEEV